MILENLLYKGQPCNIEVRTNSPIEGEKDMLFGNCYWTGDVLVSCDGDSYYLDDEVVSYHRWRDENDYSDNMIIWLQSEWVTGAELNKRLKK